MSLFTLSWLTWLRASRRTGAVPATDWADMGTAFGLDASFGAGPAETMEWERLERGARRPAESQGAHMGPG